MPDFLISLENIISLQNSWLQLVEDFMKEGWVNIIGGCCGTTPLHIRKISEISKKYKPRVIPEIKKYTRLSGLEVLDNNT